MHRYYGDVSLTRQLYVSDLTKEEIKLLKEGTIQLLNSRDSTGRRIVFAVTGNKPFGIILRIWTFLFYGVIAEDVSSQKHGIVAVYSPSPPNADADADNSDSTSTDEMTFSQGIKAMQEFFQGLPVNYTAMHFCFPDEPKYKILLSVALVMLGQEIRRRTIMHSDLGSSSVIEMLYSLQKFGIRNVPLTSTGTIKAKNAKDFLKARKAIDTFRQERCKPKTPATARASFTTDDPPGVECPENNCAVFGSAKDFKNHKGNLDFRDRVQTMVILEEENKAEETSVTDALFIDKVTEETSKEFIFRVYDRKHCWYKQIIDRVEIRYQISQAIRYAKKHLAKTQNQAQKAKLGDNNHDAIRTMGVDPRRLKRFKTDHDSSNDCGGNCMDSGCF